MLFAMRWLACVVMALLMCIFLMVRIVHAGYVKDCGTAQNKGTSKLAGSPANTAIAVRAAVLGETAPARVQPYGRQNCRFNNIIIDAGFQDGHKLLMG